MRTTIPAATSTPSARNRRSALRCLLLLNVLLVTWFGAFRTQVLSAASPALTWGNGASAPLARSEAQGLVIQGKLYVLGGFYDKDLHATKRADVYTLATNRWSRLADLPEAITHAAQAADGNTIYLLGGYSGNNPGPSTTHVWKYDIVRNSWSAGPALPAERGAGAAVVLGRTLHFFGGATRSAGSKTSAVDRGDHYVLDLDAGTRWTTAKPLPNSRNHIGATVLDGKAYVIGGQHKSLEGTTSQGEVDVYNPATDSWKRAADLPTPRSHTSASTFVMNGRIIVIGGSVNNGGNGTPTSEVTAYNPQTNTWSRLTSLPAGRKTPVAGTDGTRIVATTGSGGGVTTTTWRATIEQSDTVATQQQGETTDTPIATDTPVATDTPTASLTATLAITATDTPIATDTPTASLTATLTITATDTPVATDTPTITSTATITATPTITPTAEQEPTATIAVTTTSAAMQYAPLAPITSPEAPSTSSAEEQLFVCDVSESAGDGGTGNPASN